MSKPKLDPNRFESLVDLDTDSAVFEVGIQHHLCGPPSPAFRINTGALELKYLAHVSDLTNLIAGLKAGRKRLRELTKAAGASQ